MKNDKNGWRGRRAAVVLGVLWALGGCAGLSLETSAPLPNRPAGRPPGRPARADTLRGHVLPLPPVVVRAPMRGQANGFTFTAGKRVRRGDLLVRLNPALNRPVNPGPAFAEAPTTGIAGPPLVAGNELVPAGTPLVAITDLCRLRLLLTSRGRFARALQLGDAVQLRSPALGESAVAGTVETVGPLAGGNAHAGQLVVRLGVPLASPVAAQARVVMVRLPISR